MIDFDCKERVYAVNFSGIKVNNPSRLMGCFKLENRCNTFAECYGLVEVQVMNYAMNIPDEKVNKAVIIYPDFSHKDKKFTRHIDKKLIEFTEQKALLNTLTECTIKQILNSALPMDGFIG